MNTFPLINYHPLNWQIRYSSGPIVIAIRQKLSFQSRPWADWYFNHSSVFLVWSSSQSQGWIFCSKFKTCPRWYVKILDFGQNIHPCDWDHDQTRNTLQWLKYQSALGLDRKRNFCLIAITIVPEEYLIRVQKTINFQCSSSSNVIIIIDVWCVGSSRRSKSRTESPLSALEQISGPHSLPTSTVKCAFKIWWL